MNTDQTAEERPLPRAAEALQADLAAVQSRVTDLEQQARSLIRQRPVVAVLAAAGLGYLLARIVTRGRK